MEQRLSLVTLGVANVATSRRFYQALGWKASSVGGDDVTFFQIGAMAFSLYGRNELAKDAGLIADGRSGFGGISLAYNVHRKEDVAIVLAQAARAGARILKPAQDAFWGGHHGYFADPDGYPWEVAWNPGFELKEDGSLVLPP